jgi:type VI secretion system secreted protein VgrG
MLDQRNRMLRLRSPLGDDACVVTAFSGVEHVSDIYRYQLTLQTKDRRIHARDIIGLAVTLELRRHASPRFFHGIVRKWIDAGCDADGTGKYQLEMVPRMALLEHSSHNRIFENIPAVDIVRQLLAECGEQVESGNLQTCPRREICTQYAETDLQFVHRLLAEEGISYFFRHDSDRYTCVLADAPSGFGTAEPSRHEYLAPVTAQGQQRDAITGWQQQTCISSARLTSIDYDEYNPATPVSVTADSRSLPARARAGERQWFGQHYFQRQSAATRNLDVDAAQSQASRWLADLDGEACNINGCSTLAGLGAGLRITVKKAQDEAVQVLIVGVHHHAGDGNAQQTFYDNTFTAIDAATGFTSIRGRARPQIAGTHSAKVVAMKDPSTDGALAEVRVKFPWEQAQASCWARVAQLYAGNRWGSYFVPEIGQEVLVEFLNGNPDRPVVVGALYNRDQLLPPYTRTQSGIRTRSKNFNELRFDDRDGKEELFFQAGRDHNYRVNNDETGTIANNRSVTISNGNDETVVCSGNQTVDVAGNIAITAGQSITLQVGASILKIEPASISLQSTLIALEASAQIEISAGAVTDIGGGIVRINS